MKNKTIYVIYDAKNCQPNGDPDTGEQRYNPLNERALVSDLRIKRFARDSMVNSGYDIFSYYGKDVKDFLDKSKGNKDVDKKDNKISGAVARVDAFIKENPIKENEDINAYILRNFIDVRLFGGVYSKKGSNVNYTGALQFIGENESINTVIMGDNLQDRGITTVFPSNSDKGSGSMGRDSYIRYGLFSIFGKFNATTAKQNNATEDELNIVLAHTYDGIKSINSRSKIGHSPIAIIIINHPTRETDNGFVGTSLDYNFKPFTIKPNSDQTKIFSRDDYEFNFETLVKVSKTNMVESVEIITEDQSFIEKYLNDVDNCVSINPYEIILNNVTS